MILPSVTFACMHFEHINLPLSSLASFLFPTSPHLLLFTLLVFSLLLVFLCEQMSSSRVIGKRTFTAARAIRRLHHWRKRFFPPQHCLYIPREPHEPPCSQQLLAFVISLRSHFATLATQLHLTHVTERFGRQAWWGEGSVSKVFTVQPWGPQV